MTGLIVHEWIERTGGAEKVLEQFLALYPDANLQVLWNDDPEHFPNARETWLARTPLRRHKAVALPFLPSTWRTLRVEEEPDWILVSSHLFAHHVAPRGIVRDIPKFSYIHTPARYIWDPDLDQRGNTPIARAAGFLLKPVDRRRAQESTKIAANSAFTRERIHRAWGREADVIYPPVDVERIIEVGDWRDKLSIEESDLLEQLPDSFLLGASRFVPYKRLDAVIEAGEANNLPVVLAGRGPGRAQLSAQAQAASVPVHIIDSPSDQFLFALYQQCLAYVFPAVEDFGIMPVEAMAAGAPVIVPSVGGAAESVSLTNGGTTIQEFVASEWRAALARIGKVDRTSLHTRTQVFAPASFRSRLSTWTGHASTSDRDEDL